MTTHLNIMRHESVFNPAEHPYPVTIIGAGATGSHVFAALVGLGVTDITIFDFDTVAEHNLANQIYTHADIGTPKVEACQRYAQNKLGLTELPDTMRFVDMRFSPQAATDPERFPGGIVFLLTDTMASRQTIFDALTSPHRRNATVSNMAALIIETRMGSTHGNIFTINPFDQMQRAAWKNTLVDDEDPDNIELSPCGTTLSVGPTASLIANYAVWQMMQSLVDPVGLQPRVDLFFKPTLTITSAEIAA